MAMGVYILAISAFAQSSPGIRLSELFPRAAADCPEWLELANVSGAPVDLRSWTYGNAVDTCLIATAAIVVPAGGFIVLTKDKNLFSTKYPAVTSVFQPVRWKTLDNYHDTLFFRDSAGVQQESAGWDYKWFDSWTDQSLARVSYSISGLVQQAWVVASRPSPGQPNADAVWRNNSAALDIGPIPFTPNNDGKDDYLSIKLTIPAAATATVSIYGFDGRKYLDVPQPPTSQYLWNGTLASGAAAPVGPFFVVAIITCNGATQIIRKKGVLWR